MGAANAFLLIFIPANQKRYFMKQITIMAALIVAFLLPTPGAYSQGFIRKLKDKAENKAIDKIFGQEDETSEPSSSPSYDSSDPGSSGSRNTRGEGLVTTPPDVTKNIGVAESSFGSKNYSEAKFALKQAILGVEMEIGKSVLTALPESVEGLSKDPQSDRVTSTGIGFVGMTIERTYTKGDQELKMVIANNSAMMSAINMYMSAGAYGSDADQNRKSVTLQGNRGILEYDEYSGYKLSVPIGQSSLIAFEGINFQNEQQIMAAAEKFNLDGIMKQLGEQ